MILLLSFIGLVLSLLVDRLFVVKACFWWYVCMINWLLIIDCSFNACLCVYDCFLGLFWDLLVDCLLVCCYLLNFGCYAGFCCYYVWWKLINLTCGYVVTWSGFCYLFVIYLWFVTDSFGWVGVIAWVFFMLFVLFVYYVVVFWVFVWF